VDSDGVVIMIDGNGTEGFKKELNKNKMKKFANIKAAVHKFLASDDTPVTFESANTTDGVELFWEGELEVGTAVFIQDEEGNNIQAPEGNHAIQMDDMTVTFSVDNTGAITELEKVDAEPSDEEMDKAIEEALSEFKATQKTAMSAKDTEIKALKEEKKTLSTELTEKSEQCVALQAEMDNGGGKKKPNAGKTSYKDIMFPNRK
jgi:hypothetical protein